MSAVAAILLLPACASGGGDAEAAPPDAEAAGIAEEVTREAVGPATDLPPNELGEIMVLEYHRLGEPEGEFYRSAENFWKDLEHLYEAGFRPITVQQMVSGEIDIPRGTSPVVFTIDDASTGQFYFLEDGIIDPNSMVGMWDAFQREHPGWEGGATWCVLAGADYPSNFFGERPRTEVPKAEREERIQRKVDYLVENGHEVCNHTLFHARLDRAADDSRVQEWIGRGEDSIQVYLPENYDIVTFALPLGMWPKNHDLAIRGVYNGKEYSYGAVLEVTGGPSDSPFDVEFDPHSIPRVIVTPKALARHLDRYVEKPSARFVSDGLPAVISVPAGAEGRVNAKKWAEEMEVRAVGEAPAPEAVEAGEGESAG
jgi:hypothetical protein